MLWICPDLVRGGPGLLENFPLLTGAMGCTLRTTPDSVRPSPAPPHPGTWHLGISDTPISPHLAPRHLGARHLDIPASRRLAPQYLGPDTSVSRHPTPRYLGTPTHQQPRHLGISAPRYPGNRYPRHPGILAPRHLGTSVSRHPGIPAPRYPGTPVSRHPGIPGLELFTKICSLEIINLLRTTPDLVRGSPAPGRSFEPRHTGHHRTSPDRPGLGPAWSGIAGLARTRSSGVRPDPPPG
jgi:hypothetical protein